MALEGGNGGDSKEIEGIEPVKKAEHLGILTEFVPRPSNFQHIFYSIQGLFILNILVAYTY